MSQSLDIQYLTELVVKAQKGESDAHGALIDLTQNSLYKFCLLMSNNREVAEDLCQETYIKALQSITKLQNPKTFVGWLYQIARNLFVDHTRSAAYRKNSALEEADEVAVGSDMEAILNVQRILAQFAPEERFLLLLIEIEGYSYQEAGNLAGLSEDAVRSKLHRLRQLFIQRYKSEKS